MRDRGSVFAPVSSIFSLDGDVFVGFFPLDVVTKGGFDGRRRR
jgi:hypothetical protein